MPLYSNTISGKIQEVFIFYLFCDIIKSKVSHVYYVLRHIGRRLNGAQS